MYRGSGGLILPVGARPHRNAQSHSDPFDPDGQHSGSEGPDAKAQQGDNGHDHPRDLGDNERSGCGEDVCAAIRRGMATTASDGQLVRYVALSSPRRTMCGPAYVNKRSVQNTASGASASGMTINVRSLLGLTQGTK